MSGRKKKISFAFKTWNIILIIVLLILSILLGLFLFDVLFKKDVFYEIESRKEKISNSKSIDTPDHETIGWVRVQGTNIDYPLYGVLQSDFDYPVVSDSYLWSLSYDSNYHDTMVVYGHNIMNLGPSPLLHDENFTRMEELMGYVYYDFVKDNKYIQLSMNGKEYLYKIFAVNFMTIPELDSYPKGGFDKASKEKYFNQIKKESIYDFDVDVSVEDDILSVVTCSRFFGNGDSYDFIITGRLVREDEKIENYSVLRNKNYERIDEILKGADLDEAKDK